jgi:magnesium transporter
MQDSPAHNESMRLTFLSIILPLTFLTGLYGMNVMLPLQENARAFWIIIGLMFVVSIAMIMYFRRKKWM